MRSNRTVWGLVLLVVVAVSVLSACGGATLEPAQPAQESEPTATSRPVEPTDAPTEPPAVEPTEAPTEEPTEEPTDTPTETPTQAPTEEPTEEPVAVDAQALLEQRCTECHGLNRMTGASKSLEQWEQTVTRMVGYGAQVNDEEQAALIDYLAENYGP